jgi:hypothetical protein
MYLAANTCPSINGLFVQSQRYAQKIILGILYICLWLFFSNALIFNKNSHLWNDTKPLRETPGQPSFYSKYLAI